MSTIRQKTSILQPLGMFFLEQGKILSSHEYRQFNPVPIRYPTVLHNFGSWPRMLGAMEKILPDLWKEIQAPKKVEVRKVEVKTKEINPLESLASKPVRTVKST